MAQNSAAHLDRVRLLLAAIDELEEQRNRRGNNDAWHDQVHQQAREG